MAHPLRAFARTFPGRHLLRVLLCALMYLLEVSVMPYIVIGGVTPKLLIVMLSVMIVGFGTQKGFWCACCYGIVLQAMMPTHSIISLLVYPILTVFAGLLFADRSHRQLEFRRSQGKRGEDLSPLLRTPLCCALICLFYDIVNIAYIYLRGTDITSVHIQRGLLDILLTVLLCLLLMFPLRYVLGLRYNRLEHEKAVRYRMSRAARKGGAA